MEDFTMLKTLIQSSPGLAVSVIIVWLFLRHMKEFSAVIQAMNSQNIEALKHSQTIIEAATLAMGRQSEAITHCINHSDKSKE